MLETVLQEILQICPNTQPALLLLFTVLLAFFLQEAGVNGHSDESRAWNGTSDVDRESVLSMTMESEASNVAVKVAPSLPKLPCYCSCGFSPFVFCSCSVLQSLMCPPRADTSFPDSLLFVLALRRGGQKGTESSEGDIAGAHTDDDEDSEP